MSDYRNRVIERRRMRVGDLLPNRYNPKSHPRVQRERIQAVLERFGAVTELVAYRSERNEGQLTLFDGHARQDLDPAQEWDVAITDLSDAEVDELVLYFDPLAAQARQEADKTAALMAGLQVQERALREMLEEQAAGLGFMSAVAGDNWDDAFAGLPQGDRSPFQQMTFTLHDDQVEEVKRALGIAKSGGGFGDSPNKNSNGNALALICEAFITVSDNGKG